MQMSVHLNFQGNCAEAFAFYAKVFKVDNPFQTTYGDAPGGAPVPPDWKDKVMHASIPLGDGRLMGCDAPPGRATPLGGFQVCTESKDEAEVKRIYEALKEGGSVQMALAQPSGRRCLACARTSLACRGW
jgi:PhnB protein